MIAVPGFKRPARAAVNVIKRQTGNVYIFHINVVDPKRVRILYGENIFADLRRVTLEIDRLQALTAKKRQAADACHVRRNDYTLHTVTGA